MIEWPAVLKCADEDELMFLRTETEWHEHKRVSTVQAGDELVDSRGMRFAINGGTPVEPAVQLTLEQVLQLVRQHASVCGHCCVSKMGAPGIAEAVALVKEID